jgi:hypothetical protein
MWRNTAPGILEDYMRMSKGAIKMITPLVLAVALELRRTHGTALAASYLDEVGVALEVAVELLAKKVAVRTIDHN